MVSTQLAPEFRIEESGLWVGEWAGIYTAVDPGGGISIEDWAKQAGYVLAANHMAGQPNPIPRSQDYETRAEFMVAVERHEIRYKAEEELAAKVAEALLQSAVEKA